MSKLLNNEIENFLAEVDAIASENKVKVPKTNWIVQVDPKTNLPFYHNFVTKETTWELPAEYQKYLDEYNVYLQNLKTNPMLPVKSEEDNVTSIINLPEGNARKRRRIKRAWLRNSTEEDIHNFKKKVSENNVEFLSEYVGYSGSSSSEVSNLSRGHSPKSTTAEVVPEPSEGSDAFFGPHLPLDLVSQREVEASKYAESNLFESSQTVFQKFRLFDPQQDKLTPLQIAYIQFLTRYEDWKDGHLSDTYFKKIVEEVGIYMEEYKKDFVPKGWTLEWDSDSERFVHESLEDGIRRRNRPLDKSREVSPTETDNKYTPAEQTEMASNETTSQMNSQSVRPYEKSQCGPSMETEQLTGGNDQPATSLPHEESTNSPQNVK